MHHNTLMPVGLVWELFSTRPHKDGTDAVIACASRSLTKAESYYPAHKLEFLTLKWEVGEKFNKILV